MKKITLHTDLKQYSHDIEVKPDMPLFQFTNDGGLPVFINENFRLLPQHQFSIHLPNLCARFIKKGYSITCENKFKIHWTRPMTLFESGLSPIAYAIYLILYFFQKRISFQHTKLIVE